jgi:hypothetical protein
VIAVKEFLDDYSVYGRAYLARLSSEFEFCADSDGRCADRGFQEFMRTTHLYGVSRFILEISLEVRRGEGGGGEEGLRGGEREKERGEREKERGERAKERGGGR